MDVYEGVKIDYKGHNVTKSNFLAILEGNKTGVTGGNGRVIESTSEDHIFVYFSDHGGYGLIGFPFETVSICPESWISWDNLANTGNDCLGTRTSFSDQKYNTNSCHSPLESVQALPSDLACCARILCDLQAPILKQRDVLPYLFSKNFSAASCLTTSVIQKRR